jgi:hypothetical protein
MNTRRVASLISAGVIIGASTLAAAVPVGAKGHLDVLLDGLIAPKGIDAGPQSVAVSQGAFAFFGFPPGPVLEYRLTGTGNGTAREITGPLNITDLAVTPDGAGWGIGADGVLYRMEQGGPIQPILDIIAYQVGDPDPYNNPGEDPAESNPYGVTALPSNDVLVADAAGNDVIRVSPNGAAVTVARWTVEMVSGIPAEAVPTSIAIGRDGWAYVGQLVGFPGTPGSAHVWRVDPKAEGATCSVAAATADCAVWKSGFTSIIDLAINRNNGTMYVYEIAEGGWPAFEEGFGTGVFPPAVLLEVKGDRTRELVRGQLSQPGGVAVNRNGAVFVTDGVFSDGRLLRVRGSD